MYRNLLAEMARERLEAKKIAAGIGLSERALKNKLTGKTDFFLSEVVRIRNTFFKHLSCDYLFKTKGDA